MIQILSSLILVLAMAQDESKPESPLGFTICKNRGIVRTIRVEKDSDSKDHVTLYTKAGKDREVGRAKWRPSAESFQRNIRGNLVKAGWDCQDVKSYEVVSSKDL